MNKRKQLAIEEMKRRNASHTFETSNQTVSRLFAQLMKRWDSSTGRRFSFREYILQYDRKEYKSFLSAIKLHLSRGAKFGDKNPLNCNTSLKPFQSVTPI